MQNDNTTQGNLMDTEDIQHENVPTPEGAVAAGKELTSLEKDIQGAVAKFDLPRAAIARMKEKYLPLIKIADDDKEGFKKLEIAYKDARDKRIAVEKTRKDINADANLKIKAVNKEGTDLTLLLEEIEDPLGARVKEIKNADQRRKDEEERKRQEKLDARVAELKENGMAFNGSFWVIGNDISMDAATLKVMADNTFELFKWRVKTVNDELIATKAKADAEKEAERLRQEAIQKKNAEDAAELQRGRDELQKQKDEMQKEKDELKRQIVEGRRMQLINLGFLLLPNGNMLYAAQIAAEQEKSVAIFFEQITDLKAMEWKERFEIAEQAAADIKKQAEAYKEELKNAKLAREAKAALLKDRQQQVAIAFGLAPTNDYGGAFARRSKIMPDAAVWYVTNEVMETLDAEMWEAAFEKLATEYNGIQEAETKETNRLADEKAKKELKEKEEKEKTRQAALSDVQKVGEYIDRLKQVIMPTIVDADILSHLLNFSQDLDTFADLFQQLAKKLQPAKMAD